MSTKRRVTGAGPPEVARGQKRRKVSDDNLANQENSPPADEVEENGSSDPHDGSPEADFEGDNIQTAQDKIMSELLKLKDSDGEEVAYPFIGKPDRNLYRDYYEIIQHPVSLRSIQQKVRGTESRRKPSKTTAFPTWESFEDEVSYIWRNAREYNEDDSDIVEYFNRRLAEAKKLVPDSSQVDGDPEMPRIKLKMSARDSEQVAQRLTLKMSGQASETPTKDGPSTSVAVDNESLKRQQELVRTGSMSQDADTSCMSPRTRYLRRLGSPRSSAATTPSAPEQSYGALMNGREVSRAIKDESSMAPSQSAELRSSHGLHGVPLESTSWTQYDGMADSLPLSLVFHFIAAELSSPQSMLTHAISTPASIHQTTDASSPMDSLLRRPGQDAASALIRNISPPSATVCQQTITISLPSSHHVLTIKPILAASTPQKQTKIVALTGTHRLQPSGDVSALAYDIQLHPGTTKVDLEAIAGPPRGVPKTGTPGSDVDYERVTILFNLLR
ncbi:hypothetical protein N7532_006120 [Penicillium argentinense]|uniref:Bromo domain-containing protein n=1 Tax=Penicillium argentinense TaxID=1131581 RepID=A0A9W9KAG0_9EURO|nr:uncharacterized protein N7532_006120 [Penicillium argentinense]KAJ5099119.1 hypothetical protein N7532_006120 [Penicillium argentinense]